MSKKLDRLSLTIGELTNAVKNSSEQIETTRKENNDSHEKIVSKLTELDKKFSSLDSEVKSCVKDLIFQKEKIDKLENTKFQHSNLTIVNSLVTSILALREFVRTFVGI